MGRNARKSRGFTLAELLIVVAIIGVLVAIAIPMFANQLEKAREATDAANIRTKYAEMMVDYLNDEYKGNGAYAVPMRQSQDGWQATNIEDGIYATLTPARAGEEPLAGGTAYVFMDGNDKPHVTWEKPADNPDGGQGNDDKDDDPKDPDDDETPDNPGDTSYVKEVLERSAAEYPTGAFDGVAGQVYKYGDGLYVCGNSQHYEAGGSPLKWYQWQFIPWNEGARVLTSANLEHPWGDDKAVFPHIERGTLFYDGENYYIRKVTSDNAGTPATDSVNWQKINL